MTSNQIEFAKHKENQRHNRYTENESHRHNVADESIGWGNLGELSRHNRETESINWFSAANLATYQNMTGRAALQQADAARSQAQTAAVNAQTRKGELEVQRGTLGESTRHNTATEAIQQQQADTAEDKRKNEYQLGVWHSINETYANILETADTAAKIHNARRSGQRIYWVYD